MLPLGQAVDALQLSVQSNRLARTQLVATGAPAIAGLTKALEGCLATPTEDNVMQATRILRVLRDLRTPVSIQYCEQILLSHEIPLEIRVRGALLSEAVMAVCDLFPDRQAINIYVRFILEKEHSYSVIRDVALHWGKIERENNMTVDVLYGIAPLVRSGDPRARPALLKILKVLTANTLGHSAVWLLDQDGYTFVLHVWDRDKIRTQLRQGQSRPR